MKISNILSFACSAYAAAATSVYAFTHMSANGRHKGVNALPMKQSTPFQRLLNIGLSKDLSVEFDEPMRPLSETDKKRLTPTFATAQAFAQNYSSWSASNPNAKILCFIRHGESLTNLCELTQSYDAFSPLTLRGEKQRDEMTAFMQANFISQGLVFDQYVASNLERAYESIRPLAEENGQSPKILKRFREVLISVAGGMPKEDEAKHFPEQWRRYIQNPARFELSGEDPEGQPAFSGEVNR